MTFGIKELSTLTGRWLFLAAVAIGGWFLFDLAVHPVMAAAPFAKTLSALIGYGLVITLVCFMRWSPFQSLLAPLFDEIIYMSQVARGKHETDAFLRGAAMIGCAIYGGLTFAGIVVSGAMLAGVAH